MFGYIFLLLYGTLSTMAPDRTSENKEAERRRLLEEIRRRAEEAELRRLEEEERGEGQTRSPAPPVKQQSAEELTRARKVTELRERLVIALDRQKLDKALSVFEELRAVLKDTVELEQLQKRITALQEDQRKAGRTQAPSLQSPEVRKKIEDLLAEAGISYQYEHYDQGLAKLEQVLELDPENASALDLQEKIEAGKRFSEQVKQEEALRKAEEERLFPSAPQAAVPTMPSGADAWGSVSGYTTPDDLLAASAENVQPAAKKPPLLKRVLWKVSGIRIPWKAVAGTVAVLCLGILAYVIVNYYRSAVSPTKYSVLVLPARSLAPDTASGYLSAGFTDNLIGVLSTIPELRIVAAPTSFYFGRKGGSPLQSAREAGANFFVQWAFLRDPEKVQWEVAVADTVSGKPVWTGRYQSSLRELSAVQWEIARAVAAALGISAGSQGDVITHPSSTLAPAAYDAYVRGRWLLQYDDSSSLGQAAGAFENATREDSAFADAYAALAWAHVRIYEFWPDSSFDHLDRAAWAIRRATARGLKTPELLRASGMVEQYRGEFDKAIRQCRQATDIAPSDAESYRRLSALLVAKGRSDEALTIARRALSDDPKNAASYRALALVQEFRGEYSDALATLQAGRHLPPDPLRYLSGHYADLLVLTHNVNSAITILNDRIAKERESANAHYVLGRVLQLGGGPKEEWQRVLTRARDLLLEQASQVPNDPIPPSSLALVHTRLGEFKEAREAIALALRLGGMHPEVLYNVARAYALQRDRERAFEYLNRLVAHHYVLERILDMDLYTLRSDPEFLRTLDR